MAERPASILVVDDNPATLYATSRVLRAAGFEVQEAATGARALELAQGDVDLVVLDVNLPDFSGFEVCRRLRAKPTTSRVPVIHLSATFVKGVDQVQGFEGGADGYLTHPVEPPVLIATVQAFLRARRAEEATRRSEAKFRSIFDNAPSGIAVLDARLVHVEVNPAMARMLGRERDELIGHGIDELFGSEPETLATLTGALAQEGRWRGRSTGVAADGRDLHLDWNIIAHTVPGEYLAIVNDISELASLERQRSLLLGSERIARSEAERANRQKDEFLATVSHDLRTPLAAIVNWAQVLLRSDQEPRQRSSALQAIERNAGVAVQLIADLLDVSRIASGKLHLELQPIDAASLLTDAVESCRPAAVAKGVALSQTGTPVARWLVGDAARLQQVVWNLVSNAIKFTRGGGRVAVELRDAGPALEIVVTDDGKGIAPELLPHVFDRFRQGAPVLAAQHDGLGLGLAIVRHIVETHGGSARAHSDGEGRGATFVVRLPASVERPSIDPWGMPLAPRGVRRNRLEGVRIVVVDDDADARTLLERILCEQGAEVRCAGGTDEALQLIESFEPRILVSDIGMPERDGYELLRTLRRGGRSAAALPAIAVTAYASGSERQRALAAGFQLYLTKPVISNWLLAGIVRLVDDNEAIAGRASQ